MLVIRQAQLRSLGTAAVAGFERRLLQHIEEYFPRHWRHIGAEKLGELIHLGMARAAEHGFRAQREIFLYVSLMLYLGSHFDRDPLLPWAAASLDDTSEPDAYTRIDAAYDRTLEYMDRVAGPRDEYIHAACGRFEATMAPAKADAVPLSPALIRSRLQELYLEKYAETDPAGLDRLIATARERIATYNLETRDGALLYLGLMFVLGHGFDQDPQFAWAAAVLNDDQPTDPADRVTALRQAAFDYFRRWLA